ncbi:MAG: DUF4435 domain-containing protein [Planctomycetes bacterium]|nr:DUF4435 domain-containing protein [Planctomycetota bacterium]
MIRYAKKAIRAVGWLFRHYNDLDIYVEDTTDLNMYTILINRLLDGKASVRRLLPLGSRTEVLQSCQSDQGDGRPRLYLIDGDFDLLQGLPPPRMRHFYRLNTYCSENLVLCDTAATEIAFETLSSTPRSVVSATVDFPSFLRRTTRILAPLFAVYAVSEKLHTGLPTIAVTVFTMCEQHEGHPVLSAARVQARAEDLYTTLVNQYGQAEIDDLFWEIRQKLFGSPQAASNFISAKAFLLPLFRAHMGKHAKYRGSMSELKIRLARHCQLNADPHLAAALFSASKSP